MAQMGETRLAQEKEFMSEYWKFRKEVGTPEDNDKYWQYVCDYVSYLGGKYKGDYFCSVLVDCVIDLEHRFRNQEQEYTHHADDVYLRQLNEQRKKRNLPELVYKVVPG